MPTSKLQSFMYKRVLLFGAICTVANLVFMHERWLIELGLLTGAFFGILKFAKLSSHISHLVSSSGKKAGLKGSLRYLGTQLLTLAFLAAALYVDPWFFAGMVAGVLFIPLTILVNSLTESLGISHNNFE